MSSIAKRLESYAAARGLRFRIKRSKATKSYFIVSENGAKLRCPVGIGATQAEAMDWLSSEAAVDAVTGLDPAESSVALLPC